ncbi:MAG: MBL fold metallo-hydrolase [Gemmatimonadota bacterium]
MPTRNRYQSAAWTLTLYSSPAIRLDPSRSPQLPAKHPDVVIVSHGHSDHYAPLFIRAAMAAGIPVAVGHDINTLAGAVVLRPRAVAEIDGVRITAIESTDAGPDRDRRVPNLSQR